MREKFVVKVEKVGNSRFEFRMEIRVFIGNIILEEGRGRYKGSMF